jgi:DNA polymerase I-like protein with 3'-5' exonuclease and polymerase domains
MKVYCIDFETYYDKAFSLSKMTTEEYVRSPEFEVIGVSVCEDGGEPQWFTGTKENTKAWLDSFNLQDSMVVAHNAAFDMAILSWQFGIRPKIIVDTLSMARAIHGTEVGGSLEKLADHYGVGVKGKEVLAAIGKHRIDFTPEDMAQYGEYCKNDTALTLAIFHKMLPEFPVSELKLIDLTIRMFTEPTLVLDKRVLEQHIFSVRSIKEDLMRKLGGDNARESLMSNEQFAERLKFMGVEPPRKISPTTGKETWAFAKSDEAFKALLDHENAAVQALVAARLGVKSTLEETRTQRFMDISDRGFLPIPLRYYAAHTGRWGGDDKVNLQNLPRGSALKHAIKAPDGWKMIDSDSSQIEARVLAWLAEQNDLVDAFERKEDVYKKMAAAIYDKEEADITKDERFVGKTTILGAGYGMGAAKFMAQLKTFGVELPQEECQRIIAVYRETYEWIPTLWRRAGDMLDVILKDQYAEFGRDNLLKVEGKKGIRLPNGLYIKYPNLRKVRNDDNKFEYVYDTKKGRATIPNRIYGGKVVENICQALARIAIGEQMLLVAKKYKVVMTVHDAIACIVPEVEEQTGLEYVEMCMRMRPKWALELPLNCEAGSGKAYGDC